MSDLSVTKKKKIPYSSFTLKKKKMLQKAILKIIQNKFIALTFYFNHLFFLYL